MDKIATKSALSAVAQTLDNKIKELETKVDNCKTLNIEIPNALDIQDGTEFEYEDDKTPWENFVETLGLSGELAQVSYWKGLVELSKTTRITLSVKIKAVYGYDVDIPFVLELVSAYANGSLEYEDSWYLQFGQYAAADDNERYIGGASVGFGKDLVGEGPYLTVKCIQESP